MGGEDTSRGWENVSKGTEVGLSEAVFPRIRNAGHKRSESQTGRGRWI